MEPNPLHIAWILQDPSPWRVLLRAHGDTTNLSTGVLRGRADDFVVDEVLGFSADGMGEHELLQIRKTGLNTVDVARRLARTAHVPVRDVGYCGLKDRNAVSAQWFSVRAPSGTDWSICEDTQLQVLSAGRHRRKLRRGSHRGNRFRIVVSELRGSQSMCTEQLSAIQQLGVPNYFAEQRFGRDGNNLRRAEKLFSGEITVKDHHQRGLYLSAARAWMFNSVLSQRIAEGNWDQLLAGDVAGLEGSGSIFPVQQLDPELEQRVHQGDLHPTGPLWGIGELPTGGTPRAIEDACLAGFGVWRDGLESYKMYQERRPLRLWVPDLCWEFGHDDITLEFTLGRGCYATSVLREFVDYRSRSE